MKQQHLKFQKEFITHKLRVPLDFPVGHNPDAEPTDPNEYYRLIFKLDPPQEHETYYQQWKSLMKNS